jgi:putative flippase GtrA
MALLNSIRFLINKVIDWFYPYFKRIMPKETFNYAFCGGINTAFDIFLYFITYNFILLKQNLHLKIITFSPHIAAFLLVFPITFSSGFLLLKYITFTKSHLRGRVQLFRYALIVSGSIILNYILLKLFVDICGFYPTPSKMMATMVVIIYSYLSQRHFTFRSKKPFLEDVAETEFPPTNS